MQNLEHKLQSTIRLILAILLIPNLLFAAWFCFALSLSIFFGSLMAGRFLYETAFFTLAIGGTGFLGAFAVAMLIMDTIVDTTTRGLRRPERLLPVLIYSVSVFAISATMFWDKTPQNDTTMKHFWYIPIYINATTFLACAWTLVAYTQSRLRSLNAITESDCE